MKLTMEFVKGLGLLGPHDVDAVEALYPGTFVKACEDVALRFASRDGESESMRHAGTLVVGKIKAKRGELDEMTEWRIKSAIEAAEEWLKSPPSAPSHAGTEEHPES